MTFFWYISAIVSNLFKQWRLIMTKVTQFKKVLSGIDIILNICLGLLALAGLIMMATVSLIAGLPIVLSALFLWVFKVLAFGISYTLIQIAENTTPAVDRASYINNVIKTDLEK